MQNIFSKKRYVIKGVALAASFFCLFIAGCKDDNTSTPSCLNEYNLTPLLTNYADNIITERYSDFSVTYASLYIAGQAFIAAPSQLLLDSFQSKFQSTYIAWQSVSAFDFGPAEEVFLVSTFNNFPLNESKAYADALENNVDFSSPDLYNKGLPLLDYFLYGIGPNDKAILDSFNTNESLGTYTLAVLDDMNDKLNQTTQKWESYATTFKNNTGVKDGESLSLLVNAINKDYEFIKRNKIGVPSGVLSLGFTNPTEVEAFHSGISLTLATAAVQSSKSLFEGVNAEGETGEGLDDILNSLNIEKNGSTLTNVITNQYLDIFAKLQLISGDLSDAVDSDTENVINAYNTLSEQVIYLKSDMPSVMCIPITYVDNPSDSD